MFQKPNYSKLWQIAVVCGLALSLATVFASSFVSPAIAQEVQLGDDTNLDLDGEDETELKPSVSTDGDRVNVQVEEQPEPETKVELGDDGIGVSEEQEPAQERLDLSIPTDGQTSGDEN